MDTRTFSYSYDEETFYGKHATREEAIKAADLAPGAKLFIGRNEAPPHARTLMIGADDFIDLLQERVAEDYGECSQDFLDLDAEQKAEVQRRLDDIADYIQSIDPPTFYLVQDMETYVEPEA